MPNQAQIDYFEGLLEKHGANYKALDWNSPESQKMRFQILKEILIYGKKAADVSILDVGCGLGDLYGFFKADGLLKRNRLKYFGIDISPKLIEAARKKYRDGKFEVKDIIEDRYLPTYDYIFCCGIFNIRTADSLSHMEWVKSLLLRMYDLVNYGVAVNFLSEGRLPMADYEEPAAQQYYLFKPEEIISFCRFICPRYILRHDYHAGDFTLYLLK
ncbi:MAG: class I SAM-dependent methyltransferase [Candidatus Margulisbacteria bacterium]|nr:class I SAM-dependent methyltransferase [Candidatus Margulisiibacteriota bacterium]